MSTQDGDESVAEAAAVLERAVPMLVRWFTRGDVRRSMLADSDPTLSATDAWLLGRVCRHRPCATVRARRLAGGRPFHDDHPGASTRDDGLVSRTPDPRDGRAALVRVTPAGAARHR